MTDSALWRKLAKKFIALPRESVALIYAEKYWTDANEGGSTWRVGGNDTLRVNFEALARRAASALPEPRHPDLLFAWLEALVSHGHASFDNQIVSTRPVGVVTVKSTTGTLYKLPRHSADYCKVLESEALQSAADSLAMPSKNMDSTANVITPEPPKTATVADQIQRLRNECNWTIERLAAKVGLDESTVKRHLGGKQTPHLSTISLYQQAFSKALKKDIVISKTPPKRPLNAP